MNKKKANSVFETSYNASRVLGRPKSQREFWDSPKTCVASRTVPEPALFTYSLERIEAGQ